MQYYAITKLHILKNWEDTFCYQIAGENNYDQTIPTFYILKLHNWFGHSFLYLKLSIFLLLIEVPRE